MSSWCSRCNETGIIEDGKLCPECLPSMTTAEVVQSFLVLVFLLFTIVWLWALS